MNSNKDEIDSKIGLILNINMANVEKAFKALGHDADIISYTGAISDAYLRDFIKHIETMLLGRKKKNILAIILNTPGGSATAVEKMVEVVRYHYEEIYFIVPDSAMSAGTIFCMAGDKIFMDYASSLGPIDPQIFNGERWVPALGYIDKIEELIKKDADPAQVLTDAEYGMLQKQDLGTIRAYEQARDLSIDLLKKWLVQFKFKDWSEHGTTNPGTEVTMKQKEARAEDIAKILSDNKIWHSHGRLIGINTLRNNLKLLIEDYTDNTDFRKHLLEYNNLLTYYVSKSGKSPYIHFNFIPRS